MDSSLQAHATQAICRWLHEKYGYSKKECQAYIKGYEDCAKFMHNQQTLSFDTGDEPKEYYRITIPDED